MIRREGGSGRGPPHSTSRAWQVRTVLAIALIATLGAPRSLAVAQDTTLIAHARVFYYEGTQNTGERNEAWTLGGWMGYRTPRWRNVLGLGATLYGSVPLYAPADRDGTFLLKPGQEGYVVLGEAFGALSFAPVVVLKAGRQVVNQGYVNPSDIRMTPYTFEGVTLRSGTHSLPRYLAGYLWKVKQWNAGGLVSMAAGSGAVDARMSESLPDQREYDFRIESRWSGELGNLKLTVRGAFHDREDADRLGRQLHLIVDWDCDVPVHDGRAARPVARWRSSRHRNPRRALRRSGEGELSRTIPDGAVDAGLIVTDLLPPRRSEGGRG